ncbi:ParB N-terminal domain-containing protein [Chelatococcus sp.]|uniref:ParB N-terminal domain-containing protein n=1 Tax=Chelatococcus sp. TaxID=1953771 RepID=UPI001EC4301C|nr:ParB N-terminal domain-containing protein [Chelatococcus sp.]MBX3545553.1 ParB N-terminal domain-containing protein [Chelatococcus sp.]
MSHNSNQEITLVPLDKILDGNRLRPVDPHRALFLAASMAEKGLASPIEVRRAGKSGKYPLIVGGHRVVAARELGWETIPAFVLDVGADEARMREIDENLYRAELSELDRAIFLAEKKALYEKLNPETRHGGDRKSDQVAIFGHLMERFTAEIQDKLGCSERTIRRIVARATIPPDVRARIAFTPLASKGSELDALLKLAPDVQHAVLDCILLGGEDAPRNVAGAVRLVRGQRVADTAELETSRQLDALTTAWRRAGAASRRQFLEILERDGHVFLSRKSAA